jgi:hypothetical protein
MRGVLEGCPLEGKVSIESEAHKPNQKGGRRTRSDPSTCQREAV